VHESLDQHNLTFVAGRVLAEFTAGVELEALDQLLEVRLIHTAAQVREVLEDLSAGEIGIERRLARDIADEPLDLQ